MSTCSFSPKTRTTTTIAKPSFSPAPYAASRRNLRSVWSINTEPCPEAHFAIFPQALVEPCIKAGTRLNDFVLDPFFGAGTVGLVCLKLRRRILGIELKPEYAQVARNRLGQDLPLWQPDVG